LVGALVVLEAEVDPTATVVAGTGALPPQFIPFGVIKLDAMFLRQHMTLSISVTHLVLAHDEPSYGKKALSKLQLVSMQVARANT